MKKFDSFDGKSTHGNSEKDNTFIEWAGVAT